MATKKHEMTQKDPGGLVSEPSGRSERFLSCHFSPFCGQHRFEGSSADRASEFFATKRHEMTQEEPGSLVSEPLIRSERFLSFHFAPFRGKNSDSENSEAAARNAIHPWAHHD
ncbi:MAG: hypothetical protein EXS39_01660 [Opitutaceae bacterium]|nr:hypothetical protein [Opitutaceae bacterium]